MGDWELALGERLVRRLVWWEGVGARRPLGCWRSSAPLLNPLPRERRPALGLEGGGGGEIRSTPLRFAQDGVKGGELGWWGDWELALGERLVGRMGW